MAAAAASCSVRFHKAQELACWFEVLTLARLACVDSGFSKNPGDRCVNAAGARDAECPYGHILLLSWHIVKDIEIIDLCQYLKKEAGNVWFPKKLYVTRQRCQAAVEAAFLLMVGRKVATVWSPTASSRALRTRETAERRCPRISARSLSTTVHLLGSSSRTSSA